MPWLVDVPNPNGPPVSSTEGRRECYHYFLRESVIPFPLVLLLGCAVTSAHKVVECQMVKTETLYSLN